MGLPAQLLHVAGELTALDSRRPRQAPLRRAISTAYYALFHLLIGASADQLLGGLTTATINEAMVRSFSHDTMRRVSEVFASATPNPKINNLLRSPVPTRLQVVAALFIALQEQRHECDYSTVHLVAKGTAEDFVERVEAVFEDWNALQGLPATKLYLLLLAQGLEAPILRTR